MPTKLERSTLVTVFGGSGFVGRYTVRALAKRGCRVRAAVRRPDLAGHLQPMGGVGQIHPVQANIRYPDSVRATLEGADIAINLVAVLASTGKQTFDALHVKGARAVAKAAREAGVRRLVHMSAIGADPKAKSSYARSKGLGEQAVLEEYPDAVILRPSIIFGIEDDFYNRFAGMTQTAPFLPLIGGGRTKFQPIYVGDVADAIVAACEGQAEPGAAYELGGPEIKSFRNVLDDAKEWTGRNPTYLPVPFFMATLMAALTAPLPNALRPLTVDQVRMLRSDNVVSESAKTHGHTLQGLGIDHPQATGVIVPSYLERFRTHGQYSHYRG